MSINTELHKGTHASCTTAIQVEAKIRILIKYEDGRTRSDFKMDFHFWAIKVNQ